MLFVIIYFNFCEEIRSFVPLCKVSPYPNNVVVFFTSAVVYCVHGIAFTVHSSLFSIIACYFAICFSLIVKMVKKVLTKYIFYSLNYNKLVGYILNLNQSKY